jgi:hypothetical protein
MACVHTCYAVVQVILLFLIGFLVSGCVILFVCDPVFFFCVSAGGILSGSFCIMLVDVLVLVSVLLWVTIVLIWYLLYRMACA